MTLVDELREKARGEIEVTKSYRDLAIHLRDAGHYSEGSQVDGIADEEDGHANLLMTLANSIMSKEEPEEIKLGGRMIEVKMGEQPSRPFPETYSDWGDLAEDIKEHYPDDPTTRASVNYQLNVIYHPELGDVDAAKRWLTEKAGELGIT